MSSSYSSFLFFLFFSFLTINFCILKSLYERARNEISEWRKKKIESLVYRLKIILLSLIHEKLVHKANKYGLYHPSFQTKQNEIQFIEKRGTIIKSLLSISLWLANYFAEWWNKTKTNYNIYKIIIFISCVQK